MTDTTPLNRVDLMDRFYFDEKCRDYLESLHWPTVRVSGPLCDRNHTPLCVIPDREE